MAVKKRETWDITDAESKTLAPGEYQDKQQPALRLYVSPTGRRTWNLYKWAPEAINATTGGKGVPIRKKIADVALMNVRDARLKAAALALDLDLRDALDRVKAAMAKAEKESEWKFAYLVIGPLFLALALALRLTKVTGDIVNARKKKPA